MLQQGYCARFLGKMGRGSYDLDIIKILDSSTGPFPPVWVIHGLAGDYGFDLTSNVDEDWIRKGWVFINKFWP